MAATATATVEFIPPRGGGEETWGLALPMPCGVKEDDHGEEEEMRRRRCLREQFMASFGPGAQSVCVARKVRSHPCVLYTLKVSVKEARISWSHRRRRRFVPEERPVRTFPIVLCRAVDRDRVEPVMHRPGVPGAPDCPAVLSGFHVVDYYLHELYRERDVIRKEGPSSALWTEVAVIRGMPGGRGIAVTSHVEHLVVRLHDLLFRLGLPGRAVDIGFSEQWFRLPSGWTEERVFAEDGSQFVDIAPQVESLVRRLCEMREQEDQEMERRRSETEEERARRMQRVEEAMRRQEEEKREIYQRKVDERRRREEGAAAKPPVHYPAEWDAVLGRIGEAQPQPGVAHCSSKFSLSMNSEMQVSCKRITQEDFQHMLQRVQDGDYVLPISKTAPVSALASSPGDLELLGFVEGYSSVENCGRFGPKRYRLRDLSGRRLSSVLLVSHNAAKVLAIVFLVDKLNVLLDDGLVLSGGFYVSVDIHCDDISCSELLTEDWRHHVVCKNIDGEGKVSFSTLLVHLKKKLQVPLTEEELGIYSLSGIEGDEEIEELALQQKPKLLQLTPRKPKHELQEIELSECSMLFPTECEV